LGGARAHRNLVQVALALAGLSFLAIYRFDIVPVLGGILVLAGLWTVLARPDITTLVVVFVLYSNAAAVAIRSHHLPAPLAFGFFMVLVLPVFHHVVVRREGIRTDSVFWLMLAYLVVLVLSALFAQNPADSVTPIGTYVVEGVVLYFLIINTVRSPEVLRKAVWALLLAGALLGTLSLYQALTDTYDRSYGGFALTQLVLPNGDVVRPTIESWGMERPRAAGPVSDPNFYGQIMAAVLPLAAVFAFSHRAKWVRLAAAGAGVAIMAGIVLSFSRGAAVAVGVVAVCMFFLRYFRWRQALCFAAALAILIAATPAYRDRILTIPGFGQSREADPDPSVLERGVLLRAGLDVFLRHPLLGVGAGQSSDYIGTHGSSSEFTGMRGEALHDTYLQQLADSGVLGFSCFAAIAFVVLRNLLRTGRHWTAQRPEYAQITTGLLLAVIAFLTTSLFLHLAYMRYYWLLVGLSGAAALVYRTEMDRAAKPAVAAPPAMRGPSR
jgi:O-antigen ligase